MSESASLDRLLARYGGPGPRYTSYPPAPYFRDDFPGETLLARLRDGERRPLSLYVHVPFCRSLCWYCGCSKVVTGNRAGTAPYLDALEREVEVFRPAAEGRDVVQLALGGGSPTYLDDGELERLVGALERAFPFAADAERSVEVDPRTVDEGRIERLVALGFDRLSFGVQDIHREVQEAIHRVQPLELVERAVSAARRAGARGVSFDLILGLPHQTPASFDETLETVCRLAPDRLAIFHYAHLPDRFPAQRLLPEEALPSSADKLEMLGRATQRLRGAGYVAIGMDHFARPEDELARALSEGTLWRNFQGYSTRAGVDLLGLGPTAISAVGDVYAQNEKDLAAWEEQVARGRPATRRGLLLDADDRLRRDVILTLLCRGSLSFAEIERRHGVDFRAVFADALEALEEVAADGLVLLEEDGLRVTELGRVFLRAVCMPFDAYLKGGGRVRFSRVL